ncbi:hypothetical protein KDW_01660 [Dictyobacter vulcani]|uniref:Uncharacterized protein n=1 Tax=Dictyobacter vulcani TaxID=2607529 RepID=A0A5J4KBJ8_9CHLR|nr:hypothetical protein KDW_01660 [Dictyobacter vulcani]
MAGFSLLTQGEKNTKADIFWLRPSLDDGMYVEVYCICLSYIDTEFPGALLIVKFFGMLLSSSRYRNEEKT